jgi:hypothetical protein
MTEPIHLRLPAEHVEADALFLRHQEALLAREFAEAEALFAEFRDAVARHIAVEEREALPLYRALGPAPPGGAADLIVAEHRKIEQFLAQFAARLAAWRDQPPPPREVIGLLDAEAQFKHLMDHHDRRERSFLYPALARAADLTASDP